MNLIETIATSPYGVWGCLGVLVLIVAGYLSLMTSDRFAGLRQNNQSVLLGAVALVAISVANFTFVAVVPVVNLAVVAANREAVILMWLLAVVFVFILLTIKTVKMLPKS